MVPCAPLLALLSPDLGLAGLIANVVAAPLGEIVALPLCLTHPLTAPLPALEKGVALVASGALLVVRAVAHFERDGHLDRAAGAPARRLASGSARRRWRGHPARAAACARGLERLIWLIALTVALVAVELATRRAGTPEHELRITAIDVEQGDSTLVDLPDGGLLLVDAGGFVGSPVDPGRVGDSAAAQSAAPRSDRHRRAVAPAPRSLRRAFFGAFRGRGRRILGLGSRRSRRRRARLRRAAPRACARASVPILRPAELCGRPRVRGAATIEVLGPCPTFVPRRDANDNSLVLRISIGKRAVLLTGDAEHLEEAELIRAHGPRLSADLLKVGHHGSRTSSTPAFVAAVNPTLATISCGVRNRFGHPHAPTLTTFGQKGVLALRLDRTGSVIWQTDGGAVEVWSFSAAY